MKNSQYIAILLTATMLTACTEPNGAPGRGIENGGALSNTDVGTAVGAIGGGVLGSTICKGARKIVAAIGGTLLGGILGNAVGKSMDQKAMASYEQASQSAMQTGHTRTWKNGNNHGTVVPHTGITRNAHTTIDGAKYP